MIFTTSTTTSQLKHLINILSITNSKNWQWQKLHFDVFLLPLDHVRIKYTFLNQIDDYVDQMKIVGANYNLSINTILWLWFSLIFFLLTIKLCKSQYMYFRTYLMMKKKTKNNQFYSVSIITFLKQLKRKKKKTKNETWDLTVIHRDLSKLL